jgi:hypothetical protein
MFHTKCIRMGGIETFEKTTTEGIGDLKSCAQEHGKKKKDQHLSLFE